ncbi:SOS response-associated peptidase [Spirosoma aerolatum]|uniref:SOS response-associated peptidase n=1 Tax=Spirosoma aerolatum TaxID=1211326 RepID=UPI0009ACB83E|nr:SOS response-associated peptidase [Spirosoma aerolatum]
MCYHKSLIVKGPELEERYEANLPEASAFQPVYHANAYQFPAWPILTHQQPDQFQYMRWGLVPHWTKTSDNADEIRTRTLNARCETIYDKPSFRSAAQSEKRCLIPVTGFYEWHTIGSKKFPFYINSTAQAIVSIAGLWDEWADPETGELIRTYTLLTTEANPLLAAIHNSKKRMPCLLSEKDEKIWLQDDLTERDALALLNKQYPVSKLHSYSISKRITSRSEPSDVPEVLQASTYSELKNHPELFAA